MSDKIPSKVEAAYRRGLLLAKRRALMSDWAHFVLAGQSRTTLVTDGNELIIAASNNTVHPLANSTTSAATGPDVGGGEKVGQGSGSELLLLGALKGSQWLA